MEQSEVRLTPVSADGRLRQIVQQRYIGRRREDSLAKPHIGADSTQARRDRVARERYTTECLGDMVEPGTDAIRRAIFVRNDVNWQVRRNQRCEARRNLAGMLDLNAVGQSDKGVKGPGSGGERNRLQNGRDHWNDAGICHPILKAKTQSAERGPVA
ncbi:hypothetical protein BVI1335_110039 [Burkholderia vietnamiensis]|nr:hypothetical protein BVI1335_110039 [Burkholderia vietnamiensis]